MAGICASGVAGIGASETTDREKKRLSDGHSSKGHQSKKLKEPLSCPSSGRMDLLSEDVMGSFPQVRTNVEVSRVAVGHSHRVCKGFVDKVLFLYLFCFIFLCSGYNMFVQGLGYPRYIWVV